jgi:hypothetical protein
LRLLLLNVERVEHRVDDVLGNRERLDLKVGGVPVRVCGVRQGWVGGWGGVGVDELRM